MPSARAGSAIGATARLHEVAAARLSAGRSAPFFTLPTRVLRSCAQPVTGEADGRDMSTASGGEGGEGAIAEVTAALDRLQV